MGKVILISGTSAGLGKALAELLARRGHQVFGSSRKGAKGAPPGVTQLEMDVRSEASVQAAVQHVLATARRLDVLVNNAGVMQLGAAEEVPKLSTGSYPVSGRTAGPMARDSETTERRGAVAPNSPARSIWPAKALIQVFKAYLVNKANGKPRDASVESAIEDFRSHDHKWQTYPYTRGPNFANDGIGYGETVDITFHTPLFATRGEEFEHRRFRRTRSGLAELVDTPSKPRDDA